MPKGPPIHQLFKQPNQGGDSVFKDNNSSFNYDQKESTQQTKISKKKTLAPLPPMKKFGGYKPKILGGADNFVPLSHNPPEPEKEIRSPPPMLTKPKPFIIGDKNVPMVLSTVDNDDFDDDETGKIENGMDDMHIYDEPGLGHNYSNVETNNSNSNDFNNNSDIMLMKVPDINEDHFDEKLQTHINHEQFKVHNEHDNLIDANHTENGSSTHGTENPVFQNTDTEDNQVDPGSEPEGVFIPVPDYDEDERSMDFVEEDPDDLVEEQKLEQEERQRHLRDQQERLQRQQNPEMQLRVYEGEDLSKYLSDDDDDEMFNQNVNMAPTTVRLQQKHSLFKPKPQTHNTTGKRKSKNKQPAFNSVRNFSFADSKYGTQGKAGGKNMSMNFTEFAGDHDSFLSHQADGYETFLRSKHGVSLDTANEGNVDMAQRNGKQKDDTVWKKFTVRLKHKLQRNGYDMKNY